MGGMSEREDDERKRDLGPKDIARLDRREYREPGRDLLASKPVEPLGEGARGDVTNPVADEHSHGGSGPDGLGKVGTRGGRHFDERRKTR